LNWKITLTNKKQIKRMRVELEKNKTTKTLIEWWNWKQKKL
jgi:hypothetical protein